MANRVSDKLTALHDRVYCCRSGSAADTQALSDYARRQLSEHSIAKGAPPTVACAAKLFRSMCYSNKDRLLAGIIVAGWDAKEGGAVYEIPLGGSCVRQKIAIGGSGSSYIFGYVDSAYRPGEGGRQAAASSSQQPAAAGRALAVAPPSGSLSPTLASPFSRTAPLSPSLSLSCGHQA